MRKYTSQDIKTIEINIARLTKERTKISREIFKERQKIYNHRKYLKRKSEK